MRREFHVRFCEGGRVRFPSATRLVIRCRGTTDRAMQTMQAMMHKLRLTVNEDKTQICRLPEETFDFPGYTLGRCYSWKTGKPYIGTRPLNKRIGRLCREISEATSRRQLLIDAPVKVSSLNRMLTGWANYFRLGPVSKAYRAVDAHVRYRLRRWLCRKHKVRGTGGPRFPDEHPYQRLGLVQLEKIRRNSLCAKA